MKKYFELLRVKSYIKNFLIFIPFIFSGKVKGNFDISVLILSFFAFSFSASFVYILNDLFDCEKDKTHPVKKNRPITSGKISKELAIFIAVVLLVVSALFSYSINLTSLLVLFIYIVLNLLYSIKLKKVPVVDLLCLSLCFILRVIYGGVIFDVTISGWLYLTTLSAAFYFGIGKRKNELKINNDFAESNTRDVLKIYTENYLESVSNVFLATTIVFYSLWIISGNFSIYMNTYCLYISIIELIVVMLIYHLDICSEKCGETPVDIVFEDKVVMSCGIIFVLTLLISIFLN